MKPFRVRAGAVVTAAGLLVMGAGAGTARANGNTIAESLTGDRAPCVSHARGDIWQQSKPEGDGWSAVDGQTRLIPAVAEIPGQAFVPAVVAVPAVPQVEHREYRYVRAVPGPTEVSGWVLEGVKPHRGDGDRWTLKRLRVVDDSPSTDLISLAGGVLSVVYSNPEFTGSTLTMSLSDPEGKVTTGYIAISTSGAFAYSGSSFPQGPGYQLALMDGHIYNVVIATAAGTVIANVPVTASSGHHKEYQYERSTTLLQMSGWLTAMPEGDGWAQTESRLVVDKAAVPEVSAVAAIPFIKHVPAADAHPVFHWTRDKEDCSSGWVADPRLMVTLCHKTFATYAVETITLRSIEDAQSIGGHSADTEDIIPAFEFVQKQAGFLDIAPTNFLFVNGAVGGDGPVASKGYTYLGKNLNPGTLALLANGCQASSLVPGHLATVVPGPLATATPPAVGRPTPPTVVPPAVGRPTPPTVVPPAWVAGQAPVRASAGTGVRPVALSTEAVVNEMATPAAHPDTRGQLIGGLAGFAAFLFMGFGLVLRRHRNDA